VPLPWPGSSPRRFQHERRFGGSRPGRLGEASLPEYLSNSEKKAKTGLLPPQADAYIALLNFMADIANKYPDNVAGKYYVDNQCIDCDLCRETAPNNFKRNDDGGFSFVCKQPGSPEEEAQCKEAQEGCPVEAIGSDGG
jgi:ferredoxin